MRRPLVVLLRQKGEDDLCPNQHTAHFPIAVSPYSTIRAFAGRFGTYSDLSNMLDHVLAEKSHAIGAKRAAERHQTHQPAPSPVQRSFPSALCPNLSQEASALTCCTGFFDPFEAENILIDIQSFGLYVCSFQYFQVVVFLIEPQA